MELTGHMPPASPKEIAPMTVAVVVILATPALLVMAILALLRALANVSPGRFWWWVLLGSALTGGALLLAKFITDLQGIQLGFGFGVWFAAIIALAALVGWILGLTRAVPVKEAADAKEAKPEKDHQAAKRTEATRDRKAKKESHEDGREAAPTQAGVDKGQSEGVPAGHSEATGAQQTTESTKNASAAVVQQRQADTVLAKPPADPDTPSDKRFGDNPGSTEE